MDRYAENPFNSSDIARMLDTDVHPEVISKRTGRGNSTVSYLRGDIIADQLNQIFGPLGWDIQCGVPQIDSWEGKKETGYNNDKKIVDMHTVQVVTPMTLRIKARGEGDSDTVFRQTGIGYGEIEVTKNRKEVVGMAIKGAETDGFKRCANMLGRALGMFLTGAGSQDELEYAHNGKAKDINTAKGMRQRRLSNQGDGNGRDERQGSQSDNRSDQRQDDRRQSGSTARNDDRAQDNRGQDDRSRNSRPDDNRTGDRGNNSNQGQGRQSDERREESRQKEAPRNSASDNSRNSNDDDRSQSSRSNDSGAKAQDNAKSDAKGAGKKSEGGNGNSGAEKEKTFDLEQRPVTAEEQGLYGQTVLARLEEFNQKSDKEKFLRPYYNTISRLDGRFKRKLLERFKNDHDIEFEALGAK